MSVWDVLATVVAGLMVNECCELSPALARLLVRWSARHHYREPGRAQERAEELAAYVNDRPGKLFKLIVATLFAARALGTRRQPGTVLARSAQRFQPAPLTLNHERVPYRDEEAEIWLRRTRQMNDAVKAIHDDIEAASRNVCRWGGPGRRLRRLQKVTGDPGWATVAANFAKFEIPLHCYVRFEGVPGSDGGGYAPGAAGTSYEVRTATPSHATVVAYLAAAQQVRDDIRQLSGASPGSGHPGMTQEEP
jgi:hypothetical protein